MAALDDDYYQPQMTLEEMARQEYERRRREQERYAPPGAPAPMAPSEYVVAQAPVPPPTGDVATAVIPPAPVDRGAEAALAPALVDRGATAVIPPALVDRGAEAAIPLAPVDRGTEAALAPAYSFPKPIPPLSTAERMVAGDQMGQPAGAEAARLAGQAASALGEATGFMGPPEPRDLEGQRGRALTVSSGAPTAEPKPAAETDISLPVPGGKPEVQPKYEPRGAVGHPTSATGPRREPPPATPKANIDPNYLVRLEQSNPALHDTIVQAATAAGVGSWDYANLIYGASKGNPNYNEGGRKGLAGITDEDIQKYKSGAYAQVFANADPMNPATNLMMGALKFREMRDLYGSRTPGSLIAYRVGEDRANELSRHTPEQQREHLPPADLNFVRQAIGGPDAKPGTEPQLHASDSGTYQPRQAAQVLIKAAQEGDPRVYYRYQNDNLPRGMTSNDGWRYAETKMVTGFIRAGDMEGAQKAREMLFQMQHIGANQALMRARSYLQAGDMVGAAKEAALAYWATPDGGQARFHVTPQGIIGQRYNEATGQPVGAPFPLDENRIMGLMQITQDAGAYQKNVREAQKLNAEIEHKRAETGKAIAETGKIVEETKDIPLKRETAQDEITRRYVNDVLRSMKPGAGSAASKDPAISHAIEQEIKDYYEIKDITGKVLPSTPDLEAQSALHKDMRFNMPRLAGATARGIAQDLYNNPKGGTYGVKEGTGGVGWVYHRSNPNQAIAVLSPNIARLFITAAPAAPPPPPRIGATPASPPAGR